MDLSVGTLSSEGSRAAGSMYRNTSSSPQDEDDEASLIVKNTFITAGPPHIRSSSLTPFLRRRTARSCPPLNGKTRGYPAQEQEKLDGGRTPTVAIVADLEIHCMEAFLGDSELIGPTPEDTPVHTPRKLPAQVVGSPFTEASPTTATSTPRSSSPPPEHAGINVLPQSFARLRAATIPGDGAREHQALSVDGFVCGPLRGSEAGLAAYSPLAEVSESERLRLQQAFQASPPWMPGCTTSVPPRMATMPPPPPSQPAPGSEALPSVGSAAHGTGRCKPCAFRHTKGCMSSLSCAFCHLCEPGERKRIQKERRLMHKRAVFRGKQVKASREQASETSPASNKPAVSVKSTRASRTAVQSEKASELANYQQEVDHTVFSVQPIVPPGQHKPCASHHAASAARHPGENVAVPVSLAAALAQEELLIVESRRCVWL